MGHFKVLKWAGIGVGIVMNIGSYILSAQQLVFLKLHWWAWAIIGAVIFFASIISLILGYHNEHKRTEASLQSQIEQFNKSPIDSNLIKPKNLTQPQDIITNDKNDFIPELRDSVKNAKVVWGMWHSGDKMKNEKLLEIGTIKRVLLLDPNNNEALIHAVSKAKEIFDDVVVQIKSTTKAATKNKIPVKWYKEYNDTSISIYDPNPDKYIDGEMIPSSPEAYIIVQVLEPTIPRDLRQIYKINNSGKDIVRFEAFRDYLDYIWKGKSHTPDPKEYK
jgi:hypothetical protein